MNLHGLVAPAVGAVNPLVTVTIKPSAGYTTAADGSRVPAYGPSITAQGQLQALQYNDIYQIDGLNLQGVRRKLYLNGNWNGVIRVDQKGGDLVVLPDGTVWLVAFVFEYWPDWCSLAITLQDGS